jgi:hypothetical protein
VLGLVGGAVADSSLGLEGENEMGRLIRARDWAGSLGPIEDWPASLKTSVGLMLRSPVPLVLLWGPDGIMLYNDAYGGFAGNRHPGLLGAKVLEGWPEAADLNRRVMAVGMAGGTLQFKDERLVLNRRGTPEEGWMDLFYSPVIDETGRPGGVIAVVVETTERAFFTGDTATRFVGTVLDITAQAAAAALEEINATLKKRVEERTSQHLLVTDVGLPSGMNGRQLAEAARLGRKDLEVLFITGYEVREMLEA